MFAPDRYFDDITHLQNARDKLTVGFVALNSAAERLATVVVEDQLGMARLHGVMDGLTLPERDDDFSATTTPGTLSRDTPFTEPDNEDHV